MTESEWQSIGRLDAHVAFLHTLQLARKLRLLSIACCRQLEPWVDDPRLTEALSRAELYADGELSKSTIDKWHRQVRNWQQERLTQGDDQRQPQLIVYFPISLVCLHNRCLAYSEVWKHLHFSGSIYGDGFAQNAPAVAHQLLIDIFGNPFRPVAFDPAWRSESAVALARTAYESRNFTLLPILADALEEAGCDSADILTHCRQPDAVHVRGCWVVDLVLGKS